MKTVTLTPWEYDNARWVAENRNGLNRGNANSASYEENIERMQDNLVAETAGACAEMAVAKHLNLFWSGSFWGRDDHHLYADMPDIAPDIEVKRIRERNHNLIVKEKYAEKNLLLVVAYPHPDAPHIVDIIGGMRARKAWDIGAPAAWDRTGTLKIVHQSLLEEI
jgi:hypothetical protein